MFTKLTETNDAFIPYTDVELDHTVDESFFKLASCKRCVLENQGESPSVERLQIPTCQSSCRTFELSSQM